MGRSHYNFEKRRRELEKKKKKEAKRQAKLEKKAAAAGADEGITEDGVPLAEGVSLENRETPEERATVETEPNPPAEVPD